MSSVYVFDRKGQHFTLAAFRHYPPVEGLLAVFSQLTFRFDKPPELSKLTIGLRQCLIHFYKDIIMLKEARQYSISTIQDEVRALVTKGSIGKQHQIYALSRYFGDREWPMVERVLETNDYLLRDYVYDLIGQESWASD